MDSIFAIAAGVMFPDLFDRRLHNLVLVPSQLKYHAGSSSVPAAYVSFNDSRIASPQPVEADEHDHQRPSALCGRSDASPMGETVAGSEIKSSSTSPHLPNSCPLSNERFPAYLPLLIAVFVAWIGYEQFRWREKNLNSISLTNDCAGFQRQENFETHYANRQG